MTGHALPMAPLANVEFATFAGEVTRIVENQETIATAKITANLQEQDVLEEMIEDSKPGKLDPQLHYLVTTAFRYPPLRHGSRFGTQFEPSLMYASLELETCLQEFAFYRFMFCFDMEQPPPKSIAAPHTVFSLHLNGCSCVDLRSPEYGDLKAEIRSPQSYTLTHQIGRQLRNHGADMLVFDSARGPGSNVGLFNESAIAGGPHNAYPCNSEVNSQRVFLRSCKGLFHFAVEQFSDSRGRFQRV
ncbi:MAG: RES family NAD+ phosphorylase [Congregibacter sp.]|nr:RES family NAD+ phosphorylase [Congregibacter sp.]